MIRAAAAPGAEETYVEDITQALRNSHQLTGSDQNDLRVVEATALIEVANQT